MVGQSGGWGRVVAKWHFVMFSSCVLFSSGGATGAEERGE